MMNSLNLNAVKQANQMPINQAAAVFLNQTDWGTSDTSPNVAALMLWGLENGIQAPTIGEAAAWILQLEQERGPVGFTNLVTLAEGGEENLTPEDIETETDPLDAAATLLENLILNYKAGL